MDKINLSRVSVKKDNNFILRTTSTDINEKDILIIQGDSGAGKSTFLKSILLFEFLHTGKILFNGEEITEANLSFYRSNFTYVSQKSPFFTKTVENFLFFPADFKANKNLQILQTDIEYFFNKLALNKNLLKKSYNDLSAGEKQRICIIQALLFKRKFIILDEVTSNLDSKNKTRVIDLLQDMGLGIISVSHDDHWNEIFTRKLIMKNGSIIKEVARK